MRLGLVADLHGDIRALETALRRLEALAVDQVFCGGDLIGYGSEPDAVVAAIRDRGIGCIRGNHDRWALERRQMIGLRGWRAANLRDQTWEFLCGLPTSLRLDLGDPAIVFYHGSPASDTEPVTAYKALPPSVEEFWGQSETRVLVLGHTHIPMIERGPRGTVINPGSVHGVTGVPTSYTFAVLDTDNLSVRVYEVRTGREIRRDPIDIDES
jgi:putative phosphoesterase